MAKQEQELYSSTFAPLLRQKAAAIWSWHQIVIGLVIGGMFVIGLAFRQPLVSFTHVLMLIVLIVNFLVYHRLSVWQIIGLRMGYLLRSATGRSNATVSPLTQNTTVALLDIPGNEDNKITPYQIVNTPFAGAAMVWDADMGEATAMLRLSATSAQLASNDEKNMRAAAFSSALRSLRDRPDVVRVTIQSRSLRFPTEKTVDIDHDDSFVAQDLNVLETDMLNGLMQHDFMLGITVNPDHTGAGERATHELESVCDLLSRRVRELTDVLMASGIRSYGIDWLNMRQLRAQIKTLTDFDAFTLLDDRKELPDSNPLATSWTEFSTYMQVGPSYARSYWIDQWPDTPVASTWLASITAASDVQFVFTQVLRLRTEKKAKKELDRKLNETKTMSAINARLDREADRKTIIEQATIETQLHENAKNGGDIQFQGFVTVISSDRESLEADCERFLSRANGLLHLDRMANQQLVRWVGALPLGLEGKHSR